MLSPLRSEIILRLFVVFCSVLLGCILFFISSTVDALTGLCFTKGAMAHRLEMDIVTRVCVHSISRPDLFAIVSEVFICWVHFLITDNDHPIDFAMRAFSSLRRQKRNTETGQERETERETERREKSKREMKLLDLQEYYESDPLGRTLPEKEGERQSYEDRMRELKTHLHLRISSR
jgi:hypothetical protein